MTTISAPILIPFPTKDALRDALSAFVTKASAESIAKRGVFAVAISGGNVPKLLGGLIDNPNVQWNKWHVYYADERVVPLEHPDSNHKLCTDELWSKVPIPENQIHPIDTTDSVAAFSEAYARDLTEGFDPLGSGTAQTPFKFDLALLRMGSDGHTASLFPGSPALWASEDQLVACVEDAPREPKKRVTFTLPLLNRSSRVAFVCTGAEKAEALKTVLDNPDAGLPAARVKPTHPGQVYWFVDEAAAGKVEYPRTPFQL
ncbi:hypothetical protein NMY22_g1925 [Coprinellus aureogranulatus]|nr:hypothetical protein NMY22_g1925 [Coprinellus aureogranulatus]